LLRKGVSKHFGISTLFLQNPPGRPGRCLAQDNTLELLIEAKRSEDLPARALINFSKRYDIPAMQLVLHLKREGMDSGCQWNNSDLLQQFSS
jgi:hypothetical protein